MAQTSDLSRRRPIAPLPATANVDVVPALPPRIPLAQLPTPFERLDRLTAAWAGAAGNSPTIWVKRDDLTGFELSGNKVRKLEFHLAAARAAGADTVITCGAVQSNHCRATALAAARLGLRSVLAVRTADGRPVAPTGNHLLHHLGATEILTITPEAYDERDAVMKAVATDQSARGHSCWIIPEGASDALGMWGFVLAMRELAEQFDAAGIERPPTIWHAASSGGTTAGIAWAVDRLKLRTPVIASSVGDAAVHLEVRVNAIWHDALDEFGGERPDVPLEIIDSYVGGGYAVVTRDELAVQRDTTKLTGLLFDPTYTGKALFGLRQEIRNGRWSSDDHVVFWHTGGGFSVFADEYRGILA
jgi:D-cysteine desulfhydrase